MDVKKDSVMENRQSQQEILIKCRRVMNGDEVLFNEEGYGVFISNDKIQDFAPLSQLTKSYFTNPKIHIIDLISEDYTLLPGLIDCHCHPMIFVDNYQIYHLQYSSAYKALLGLSRVTQFLQCGWTTIRVAGDADIHYAMFDVRRSIQTGLFQGPRIVGAGHYLSITGGGGDLNQIAPEQCCVSDGKIVDGIDEMRKAVREEIKYGADWIKLLVTGAYMSAGDSPLNVHFTDDEIITAVEEAKRFGKSVMAHAHSAAGILKSIRCGVRSIEHATLIDDQCIQELQGKDIWVVPTLYIGEYYNSNGSPSGALDKMLQLQKDIDPSDECIRKILNDETIKIAVGTDYAGWDVNLNYNELVLLNEGGMSNLRILKAATSSGAELLRLDDKIGRIACGMVADVIAIKGNPLEDIKNIKNICLVVSAGKVVRLDLK